MSCSREASADGVASAAAKPLGAASVMGSKVAVRTGGATAEAAPADRTARKPRREAR